MCVETVRGIPWESAEDRESGGPILPDADGLSYLIGVVASGGRIRPPGDTAGWLGGVGPVVAEKGDVDASIGESREVSEVSF